MISIYLASSWRNKLYPGVLSHLRASGFEVYDFRKDGFSWESIDENWTTWTNQEYMSALREPAAERGFKRDMDALVEADVCVLLLPCGKSAHLEAGYAVGQGKSVIYLLEPDATGPDESRMTSEAELMSKMCYSIRDNLTEVIEDLKQIEALGEHHKMMKWGAAMQYEPTMRVALKAQLEDSCAVDPGKDAAHVIVGGGLDGTLLVCRECGKQFPCPPRVGVNVKTEEYLCKVCQKPLFSLECPHTQEAQ